MVREAQRVICRHESDVVIFHMPENVSEALFCDNVSSIKISRAEDGGEKIDGDAMLTLQGLTLSHSIVSCGGIIVEMKHDFGVGNTVQIVCK